MTENDQLNELHMTSSFVNINNIDDLSEIETSSILSGITDDEDYINDSDFQPVLNSNHNWISDSESESGKYSHSEDSSQQYDSTPKKPKKLNDDNDADRTPQRSQTLPTSPATTPNSQSILTNTLEFTSSCMADSNASLKLPSVVVDSFHKSEFNSNTPHEPSTIELFAFDKWNESKNCRDNHHLHSLFPKNRELTKAGFLETDKVFLPSLDVVVFDSSENDEITDYNSYISICKKLQRYTSNHVNLYVNRIKNNNTKPRFIYDFTVNQVINDDYSQVVEIPPEEASYVANGWIKPNTLVIVSCNIYIDLDYFFERYEFGKLPVLSLVSAAEFTKLKISMNRYQNGTICSPLSLGNSSQAMPVKSSLDPSMMPMIFPLTIPEFLENECCVQQTILSVFVANNFLFGLPSPFNTKFIRLKCIQDLANSIKEYGTLAKNFMGFLNLLVIVVLLLFFSVLMHPELLDPNDLPHSQLSQHPTSLVSQSFDSSIPAIETTSFDIPTTTYTEVVSVTKSVIIEVTTITAEPDYPSESSQEKSKPESKNNDNFEASVETVRDIKVYMVLSEGDHDEPLGADFVFPIAHEAEYHLSYEFTDGSKNTKIYPWYQRLSEDTVQLVIPRKNRHGYLFGRFKMVSSGVGQSKLITINYGQQENIMTEVNGNILAEYKYDCKQGENEIPASFKKVSAKLAENLFKGSTIIFDATERSFKSGSTFAQHSVEGLGKHLQNTCDSIKKVFQKAEPLVTESKNFKADHSTGINYAMVSSGIQDFDKNILWFSETTAKIFETIFSQIHSVFEDMYHEFGEIFSSSWGNAVSVTGKVSYNVENALTSSFLSAKQAFEKVGKCLPSWEDSIKSVGQTFGKVSTLVTNSFNYSRKAFQKSDRQVLTRDDIASSAQKAYSRIGDIVVSSLKRTHKHTASASKTNKLFPALKKNALVLSDSVGKLERLSSDWVSKKKALLVKKKKKGFRVWWAEKLIKIRGKKKTRRSMNFFQSKKTTLKRKTHWGLKNLKKKLSLKNKQN